MTDQPGWSNWAGTARSQPTAAASPRTAEEVVAEVRRARADGTTVKMVGTGHSFTSISAPEGRMLRPEGLRGIVSVDRDAMTVTALAGTRLADLNAELAAQGLSLHNMGDIAEQTLAGAVSTGTHGTGGVAAGLSAQLAGLSLVTGSGLLLECTEDANPDVLEMARVGLGALGILVTLTFRVEPLFVLEAHERPMRWDEALGSFDELVAEHHHCDLYWFPHTDRLLVKTNDRLDVPVDEAAPLPRWREWLDDEFLSNTVFGGLNAVGNLAPRAIPALNQLSARALSARTYSDVAHRVFTSPRTVRFREMEYAVPRAAGLDALREVRRVLDASGHRVTFPIEVRVAPADDIPLSTASGRDSVYLAFHVNRATDHRPYFADMEPIVRALDGRPHWGKLHTRSAADLAPVYPRFGDFQALRDRLDPDRVFANAHLREVLGE